MLVDWFAGQAWANETRRSYRAAARGFFTWAYKSGRTPVDLADELPKIREHRGAARPAPEAVWRQAVLTAAPRVRLMLRLAAEAGLRRGEIACVHGRDLLDGIDGAQLLVHGKGGKQRVIPISGSLAEQVRAAGNGWLFPSAPTGRGHVSPEWVGEQCADALPDGYTMHTLRHRFASAAFRGTRNIRAVQVLLGHASLAVTERYVSVDDSEVRAAAMAAALAEELTPGK